MEVRDCLTPCHTNSGFRDSTGAFGLAFTVSRSRFKVRGLWIIIVYGLAQRAMRVR